MLLYPLRDAHDAIYHLADLSSSRLAATLTRKLSEVCVQQCGLTRQRRKGTSWSLIPAQLASLYNFTCSEIVTLVPLARTRTVPLSVCSTDQDHETICSQSCRRPSRTIYRRPVLCDKLHDSGFRHNVTREHHGFVQPAPPSPVLAAIFLDLFAIAACALCLTAHSCRRASYNGPSKAFRRSSRSTRRPCAFV